MKNRLTELNDVENKGLHRYSLYLCECGTKKVIRRSHVSQGRILSCGCHSKDIHTTHGMSNTQTYERWEDMKVRCSVYSTRPDRYIERKITVCSDWKKFESFYNDMGECNGLSLDRIDNNKGYYKENCRWTTRQVQMRNTANRKHSSQYRGVSWHKARGKWRAYSCIDNKSKHLGLFDNEAEAAKVRDDAMKHLLGVVLNFSENKQKE